MILISLTKSLPQTNKKVKAILVEKTMRKLLLISIPLFFFISCKECLECKYSTLKGPVIEKFCSSTPQDREDFETRINEEAAQENSRAICTKERY